MVCGEKQSKSISNEKISNTIFKTRKREFQDYQPLATANCLNRIRPLAAISPLMEVYAHYSVTCCFVGE